MTTYWFGMAFLLNDDRRLKKQSLSCIFAIVYISAASINFDLNCWAIVAAGLNGLILGLRRLFIGWNCEITVVCLKGMHDLGCLFAKGHIELCFKYNL